MSDMVVEKIKGLVRAVSGVYEGPDGYLNYDLYVDDATVGSRTLKEIVEAEGYAEDAFYHALADYHTDVSDEATDYIKGELVKLGYGIDEEEADDIDLNDVLREVVEFNFPYADFLKQRLLVNVVVDSGDANYDYSINRLYEMSFEDPEIRESGLVWLAAKQGYDLEDVRLAVHENKTSSTFLRTLDKELANTTSGMNALTFLLEMTLGEVIDVLALGKKIQVVPGTRTGLVDFWNGAGGTLGIELERGFVLEASEFALHIDGQRGYGVESIYGATRSTWSSQYQIV